MATASLTTSALLGLILAVAFLFVGGKIHQRSRTRRQPGLAWFAAFWVGIGTYGLAESAWAIAYLGGHDALAIGLFVLHLKIVGSVGAFAGLVAYLLTIHARDTRLISVLVGAYAIVFALTETFYSWRDPIAQEPGIWGMRLLYSQNATEPWWTMLLILLFLPPFLAALSYANLLRHTRDPALRYRIALTSWSLLLFFVPLFLGWRAGGWAWWGAIEKALSVAMASGIVLALWPPRGVQRWLAGLPWHEPEGKLAQLVERARQLV